MDDLNQSDARECFNVSHNFFSVASFNYISGCHSTKMADWLDSCKVRKNFLPWKLCTFLQSGHKNQAGISNKIKIDNKCVLENNELIYIYQYICKSDARFF